MYPDFVLHLLTRGALWDHLFLLIMGDKVLADIWKQGVQIEVS